MSIDEHGFGAMTKLDTALAAKLCAEAMEDVCPCCNGAGERAYAQHDPEIPRWGTCVDCDGFGIRTRPAPTRALAEQLMAALEVVKEMHGRVLHPLTRDEVVAALHEGHAESRAASGDNAWSSLLAQRDAALREVERMRPVYEAAEVWWSEGVRPHIPYRAWSTATTEKLLAALAKHFSQDKERP